MRESMNTSKLPMPKKLKMHNHGPHYWKNVQDRLETFNRKQQLINFRKHLLDSQNRNNYSSEYERIRGILNHSRLPSQTVESLKKRKEQLAALGAKAFSID
jgi:hypothetical protein